MTYAHFLLSEIYLLIYSSFNLENVLPFVFAGNVDDVNDNVMMLILLVSMIIVMIVNIIGIVTMVRLAPVFMVALTIKVLIIPLSL